MERLTNPEIDYSVIGFVEEMRATTIARMLCRLASYEDIGWSPEELRYIHDNAPNLLDLVRAEQEGRLVVLPCKEGAPIYCDGSRFAPHCAGEIHEVVDWYYTPVMMRKDFRGEADYIFDPADFEKTWFLTRAEAEAAMKGADDEKTN